MKIQHKICRLGKQCVWVNVVNPCDQFEFVYVNTSSKYICNHLHPKESVNKMLERTGKCDTVK